MNINYHKFLINYIKPNLYRVDKFALKQEQL